MVSPMLGVRSAEDDFSSWRRIVCEAFVEHECDMQAQGPFYGRLQSVQAGDMSFSTVHSSGQLVRRTVKNIRQDDKDLLLFLLQIGGECSLEQDGRTARLKIGDVACFDTARPYQMGFAGDFSQIIIQVPSASIKRIIGSSSYYVAHRIAGDNPIAQLTTPFLIQAATSIEALSRSHVAGVTQACVTLLTNLFSEMLEDKHFVLQASQEAILARAKLFVENNLHDPNLDSGCVARSLGISQRYLQQLFNAEKSTPTEFLWNKRLERARALLMDPKLKRESVSQIAFTCGFSNLSHFSRRFKTSFSMTPRKVR